MPAIAECRCAGQTLSAAGARATLTKWCQTSELPDTVQGWNVRFRFVKSPDRHWCAPRAQRRCSKSAVAQRSERAEKSTAAPDWRFRRCSRPASGRRCHVIMAPSRCVATRTTAQLQTCSALRPWQIRLFSPPWLRIFFLNCWRTSEPTASAVGFRVGYDLHQRPILMTDLGGERTSGT